MTFRETSLQGAFIIEPDKISDERGFFARSFCAHEFEKYRLKNNMVQSNISHTVKKHTIRGMHYQIYPHAEAKLVRCTKGKILDVIIDIRKDSSTYCRYFPLELSAQEHRMLYIPEGFAHGFITLTDNCEVFYLVSNYYSKENERGIRWNDPLFGIQWPCRKPIVSEKDSIHPDFKK